MNISLVPVSGREREAFIRSSDERRISILLSVRAAIDFSEGRYRARRGVKSRKCPLFKFIGIQTKSPDIPRWKTAGQLPRSSVTRRYIVSKQPNINS